MSIPKTLKVLYFFSITSNHRNPQLFANVFCSVINDIWMTGDGDNNSARTFIEAVV